MTFWQAFGLLLTAQVILNRGSCKDDEDGAGLALRLVLILSILLWGAHILDTLF